MENKLRKELPSYPFLTFGLNGVGSLLFCPGAKALPILKMENARRSGRALKNVPLLQFKR
jgi:hypothetical protein